MKQVISLTTDFGLKDSFVGLMKGVIYGINPDVNIVDITHDISRHDIAEAALVISISYRFFPLNSVHVVVTDPGVGGSRRPIMVITKDHCFIGPDNGIFTYIYEEMPSGYQVIHLTATHHFLKMSGSTFHGRDIFAPVAAWFSRGLDSAKFGDEITDYVTIPTSKTIIREGGMVQGMVVSIDHFGNAITNIRKDTLEVLGTDIAGGKVKAVYQEKHIPIVAYYQGSSISERQLSAVINSFGLLELFLFKGNAAIEFGISVGDEVLITKV